MDGSQRGSGTPSLRDASGEWVHDPKAKADLFADVFTAKYGLPAPAEADPEWNREPSSRMSSFILVRERWVKRELAKLREDQATGPDCISARLLRMCADVLARPVTDLLRKIVREHRWPLPWKFHRLCPLYKRGAVFTAGNYRGLHLTSVLSKVAERVLKIPLGSFIDAVDAFGENQWAFRRGRGCPDLVLLLICSLLRDFNSL